MFTNDIVQHLNQIWFDLPYYVRSKQYGKAFGTMANVAIAGAISLLVSGQLVAGQNWQSTVIFPGESWREGMYHPSTDICSKTLWEKGLGIRAILMERP